MSLVALVLAVLRRRRPFAPREAGRRTDDNTMALAGVVVHPDVLLAALGHALTTEKEEIMGLLLGDFAEVCKPGTADGSLWSTG